MYQHCWSTFVYWLFYKWAGPCENVSSDICRQRRPWPTCASAQTDLGLRCPQTKSFYTIECYNGEQMFIWDFVPAYMDVNLRMFEGTFYARCSPNISKGWTALKWQILWETNKFQVSFCSPFKFVRHFFVEKKTSYSEQQRRWSACADAQADLRLCCSLIY